MLDLYAIFSCPECVVVLFNALLYRHSFPVSVFLSDSIIFILKLVFLLGFLGQVNYKTNVNVTTSSHNR